MSSSQPSGLVLAVHPTSRGFGWVLFEGPIAAHLWGIAGPKESEYGPWCMRRFEKLLTQYSPTAIVLEHRKPNDKAENDRAWIFYQNMRGFAANRDIAVHIYSRAEVGAALVSDKNATRRTIVEAVADLLPMLRDRLPLKRKRWDTEDGRRCLFDAAALGIAHYRITRGDS
jgi:Holliday junction resolvasome RuvABC endonuclease subunit